MRIFVKTITRIFAIVIMIGVSNADIPHYINFQGYLIDSGDPVSEVLNITFRIFNAETEGTLLWNETNSVEVENGVYSLVLGQNNVLDLPFGEACWLEIQVAGQPAMTPRYMLTSNPYSYKSQYSENTGNIPDQIVTTNKLADNAVTTSKLTDDSVTREKIEDGAIDSPKITTFGVLNHNIAYNAVSTANIINGTISVFDIGQNDASLGQILKWNGSNWWPADDETDSGGDSDWITNGPNIYRLNGNVGIGTSMPGERLEVAGNMLLNRDAGKLILRTINHNTAGRAQIKFDNNYLGIFSGDDTEDQYFSFMTDFAGTRAYDAKLRVHGRATGDWYKYIELTHDGTDGRINTDSGDLVLGSATGRVGIGTSDPNDLLEVVGNSAFISVDGRNDLSGYRVRENGADRWILFFRQWQSNNLIVRDEVGGLDVMTFESNTGNVGIGVSNPEQSLHVSGKIKMDGIESLNGGLTVKLYNSTLWYQSASSRNKSDIQDFKDDFNKILRANPVAATDINTGIREIGYTAEDFMAIGLDNLVIKNNNGQPEAIKYDMIPLYLVEVIKKQNNKIDALAEENQSLKNIVDQFESRISNLEKSER